MFFQFFVHIVDPNDWGSVGRTLSTSSQMLGEAPSRVGAASRAGLMMRIMRLRPGRMRISRMMMMMMMMMRRRRTSMSTRMKMRMRMMRVSNDGDDCGDDW